MRCTSEKDRKKIEREVHRLQLFVHPGIVELKEVIAMENMQAIVMELGEQSLAQVVKSHSEREVLIGDLGAAESEDGSSTRGVMSMQYVSPERMEDVQGRASGSSDVWALGIVLHFLLFGKSPFRSEHAPGLIREIGSFKATQIGKSCGEKERELLMRMLDPDCGSRLTSKQLVESRILRCLINTTEEGWKLSEMKSRETEKRVGDLEDTLRTSEAKVAELTRGMSMLQNRLKEEQAARHLEHNARMTEREEAKKERNELRRKMDEMAAMMRTGKPKGMDGKEEGRKGTELRTVGPRSERTGVLVVSSRIGADAIEVFTRVKFTLSGNVFTKSVTEYSSLFSLSFGPVVVRITFVIILQ
ncbi:hypothetical protein BLNAU_20500 [Blattamonas nauphoetae]|uniref:Protein kinase domain-containing protein n=1 Tax=Blattamonas nauphoetae TaxID=2049346 RepID=A0ABQ9WZ34_9EUKA|nr:hypothetical protein BLNAU_20500 [Blattamonas nauphoetae]